MYRIRVPRCLGSRSSLAGTLLAGSLVRRYVKTRYGDVELRMALNIFNLGIRLSRVVSVTHRPLYPRGGFALEDWRAQWPVGKRGAGGVVPRVSRR